jgi:choice-of-anchor B domain-containing protein
VRRSLAALLLVLLGVTTTAYAGGSIFSTPEQRDGARAHLSKDLRPPLASEGIPTTTVSNQKCVNGKAGTFSCKGVDLLSFVPLSGFKGSEVLAPLGGGTSDLWGWTDPKTRDEYVLIGKTNGTGIFRVTNPLKPVYLGAIDNVSPAQLIWHDIKIYKDHAFIVSESAGHGMRVFDLTRLRDVTTARSWTEDVNYPLAFSAHNIAINEATGYAYIVGGNNGLVAPDACLSGLHMVDIRDPKLPKPAGCQARGGGPGTGLGIVGVKGVASYVHDTQCVLYRGPDKDHQGKEICLNSAETHLQVVDVTNKLLPVQIGEVAYPEVGYAHQGWLTDDQRTFLMGDELDEGQSTDKTRTLIFDVADLDKPRFIKAHLGSTSAIDHNMYVKNGLVYQSNYAAGLRILDTRNAAKGKLSEVAFFDSFPAHDKPEFVGSWSNYPYFASGTIAFSGIDDGLFLVRVQKPVLAEHATRR